MQEKLRRDDDDGYYDVDYDGGSDGDNEYNHECESGD